MLSYLEVKNYIFINSLKLEFHPGLNIFTGETGAGKSIIVEAISLLCGEKISSPIVGKFSEKCELVGIFNVESIKDRIVENLQNINIDFSDQLILRREIDKLNRSRCFINDSVVSLSTVKIIGDIILDIHGQNQHQKLLLPSNQLSIIDSYAGITEKVKEFRKKYEYYKKLLQERANLYAEVQNNKEKLDILQYQINEIEQANLTPEDEKLEQELNNAKNAQKILSILAEIKFNLQEINQKINNIEKLWKSITDFSNEIKMIDVTTINEQVENIIQQTEEYKKIYSSYTTEYIDSLVDRVDLIKKLKRKYGSSIEEIKNYALQAKAQLQQLNTDTQKIEQLEQEIKDLESEIIKESIELSHIRQNAAKKLQDEVNKEFTSLGLKKAKLEINIQTLPLQVENLTPTGFDKIEFLVSTNPGTPFLPLREVASGGELSRIMLSIKTVLGNNEDTPILIFDEIDSGVGGPTGFILGKKLKNLSLKNKQIFCITHLPQIACFADKNFVVEKEQKRDTTYINVKTLSEKEKVQEIARMLSGSTIDDISLKHAKNLIQQAQDLK
ncbi:MAG: DNA repair protein RecN [Endomicrobia bacterium]|nr:DNA repair protein RecN [Endomicrobiia bacterium]MCX7940439.1 DNA repair protein RecN [Endomicrobiia bacterium]